MQINFCGGSYEGRSINIDASRSVNFFPENSPSQDGKTQVALIGTPGTIEFCDFGSGEIRGIYNARGRCIVIVGDAINEVFADGTFVLLATLPDSTGIVEMADNGVASYGVGGDQIILLTNGLGYIYNLLTDTLVRIIDLGFPINANQVVYLDGYFIVTNLDCFSHVFGNGASNYNPIGMTW